MYGILVLDYIYKTKASVLSSIDYILLYCLLITSGSEHQTAHFRNATYATFGLKDADMSRDRELSRGEDN